MPKLYQQVELDDIDKRLDDILKQIIPKRDLELFLYIWGMGAKPKDFYEKLDEDETFKVICYESVLRRGLLKKNTFIPSYAGLIEIKKMDKEKIKKLFFSVGEESMVGLYILRSQQVAKQFVNTVCENISAYSLAESIVERDKDFFSYTVDLDNDGHEICEIVGFNEKNLLLS